LSDLNLSLDMLLGITILIMECRGAYRNEGSKGQKNFLEKHEIWPEFVFLLWKNDSVTIHIDNPLYLISHRT
jgi:hypothetical protein